MERNKSLGIIVLFVILGLILGGVFGEALGYILGKIGEMSGGSSDNPISNTFVRAWDLDLGFNQNGWTLDLYLIKIRLGLGFKFNACSIGGMFLALYMMKWWRS